MRQLRDFAGDVSVVVSSCDAFFDAWRPFAFFFRKFWPDCPFPVYLVTDHLDVRSASIRALPLGREKDWAGRVQAALEQIATPHVLYLQEDYFLTSAVDEEQLARDFAHAIERDAASLCFRDLSGLEPESAAGSDRIMVVPRESTGRTRLQTALWKRDVLAAILVRGETPWDMEARGSARTRDLLMLTYTRNANAPVQYLVTAIVRGLWTPQALALCRAHGVKIEPHFRRTLVEGKGARRWNRALTRAAYIIARARQRGRPVELD